VIPRDRQREFAEAQFFFMHRGFMLAPRRAEGRVTVDLVKPRRWRPSRPKYVETNYAKGENLVDAPSEAVRPYQREFPDSHGS
jgi:hypothetical protein